MPLLTAYVAAAAPPWASVCATQPPPPALATAEPNLFSAPEANPLKPASSTAPKSKSCLHVLRPRIGIDWLAKLPKAAAIPAPSIPPSSAPSAAPSGPGRTTDNPMDAAIPTYGANPSTVMSQMVGRTGKGAPTHGVLGMIVLGL